MQREAEPGTCTNKVVADTTLEVLVAYGGQRQREGLMERVVGIPVPWLSIDGFSVADTGIDAPELAPALRSDITGQATPRFLAFDDEMHLAHAASQIQPLLPKGWQLSHSCWVGMLADDVCPPLALSDGIELDECVQADWDELAGTDPEDEFTPALRATQRRLHKTGNAYFAVARQNGRLAGSAGVVLTRLADGTGVGRMQDVETVPEYRRRGVASHLIARCHAWARNQGASATVLVADASGETASLYTALGYREVERLHIGRCRPETMAGSGS